MRAKPKYENGFTLEPGTQWRNERKPSSGKGFYVVESTGDEDEYEIVAKLSFDNGELNGKCIWYTNEKPSEEFTYRNNVIDGWGCLRNEERITHKLYYQNGQLKRKLEYEETIDGYFKEIIPIGNNDCIGIFRFDDEFRRQGIGYEMKNGSITKVAEYDKDKEIRVIKRMENGRMEEYDKNKKKCYSGKFEDNLSKQYPRCGGGDEFKDGWKVYSGEWKENKRNGEGTSFKNGTRFFTGMWFNGLPEGNGSLFDERGSVKYSGIWKKGRFYISGQNWYDYETDKIIHDENAIPPTKPQPSPSVSQSSFPIPIDPIHPISVPNQSIPVTPGSMPHTTSVLNQSIPVTPGPMSHTASVLNQSIPVTPGPNVVIQPTPGPSMVIQPTPGPNVIIDPTRYNAYPRPSPFIEAPTVMPTRYVQVPYSDSKPTDDPSSVKSVVVNPEVIGIENGSKLSLNPPKSSSEKTKKVLIITAVVVVVLALIGIIAGIIYNAQEIDVTITTYKEFKNIDKRAKTIVIESFGILEVNAVRLDFGELKKLQSISIGSNACTNVMALRFYNLPNLETITIGENSFTTKKGSSGSGEGHYVEIMNCPKLISFTSEAYSFSTFGGFKVSATPLLEQLTFGQYAWDYMEELDLTDLPKLSKIVFGFDSFEGSCNNAKLTMKNLPALKTITSAGLTFNCANIVHLEDIPNLTTVILPESFKYVSQKYVSSYLFLFIIIVRC